MAFSATGASRRLRRRSDRLLNRFPGENPGFNPYTSEYHDRGHLEDARFRTGIALADQSAELRDTSPVRFRTIRTYTGYEQARVGVAPVVSTGSNTKFRRAFDAHFDALNQYCLRRVPVDDVNDVVAEVFTVAWRKVDKMPDGDDTLPWLYRVAHHEISNRRRSNRRFRALVAKLDGQGVHPEPEPESIIVRNSDLDHLLGSLSTLRVSDQEALLLHTHEDLGYSQMSVALGCSPEAARKRLTRAIRRLRQAAGIPEPQHAISTFRAIEEGGDQ